MSAFISAVLAPAALIVLGYLGCVYAVALVAVRLAEYRQRTMEIDRVSGFHERVVPVSARETVRAHGGWR